MLVTVRHIRRHTRNKRRPTTYTESFCVPQISPQILPLKGTLSRLSETQLVCKAMHRARRATDGVNDFPCIHITKKKAQERGTSLPVM